MKKFGLIGDSLAHSFSKIYFTNKFKNEGITNCSYDLFELKRIDLFPKIIGQQPNLRGLNVTIPYKEAILPFLTNIDEKAKAIGAVNTIKLSDDKKSLIGYNTDYDGFKKSLKPFLDINHERALILGTVTIKRLSKWDSPFVGGKDHTTHHLAYLGFSEKQVAAIISLMSIFNLGSFKFFNFSFPIVMLYYILLLIFESNAFFTLNAFFILLF